MEVAPISIVEVARHNKERNLFVNGGGDETVEGLSRGSPNPIRGAPFAARKTSQRAIEMDIRWTRDDVPVVFHDPDARRLFGRATRIADTPMEQIKRQFPAIPMLSEVVARYGGRVHLMMEIKAVPRPDSNRRVRRLGQILQYLTPGKDFHLMALQPDLFAPFGFLPSATFLPIARVRMDRFSRMAESNGWGGVTGHYLMAGNGILRRHHRLGQCVGTGFADSRRCLYREVARGVDWIFSNRAAAMQAICSHKHR